MTPIYFSRLGQSLERLAIDLSETRKDPWSDAARLKMVRQFKLVHDLAIESIRHVLVTEYGDLVNRLSWQAILRKAAERGLINDVEIWIAYRTATVTETQQNDMSHISGFVSIANGFLRNARLLLMQLHGIGNRSTIT